MTVCYNKTVSQFQVPTFPNWQETIPTLRQCHPTRLIGAPHSPTIFLLVSASFGLQGFWSAHSYQQASSASSAINHSSLPCPLVQPLRRCPCSAAAQAEIGLGTPWLISAWSGWLVWTVIPPPILFFGSNIFLFPPFSTAGIPPPLHFSNISSFSK